MLKTVILTSLALIAFAANSVLCRSALGEGAIDPSSFTVIRLLSGAIVLFAIIHFKNHPPEGDPIPLRRMGLKFHRPSRHAAHTDLSMELT